MISKTYEDIRGKLVYIIKANDYGSSTSPRLRFYAEEGYIYDYWYVANNVCSARFGGILKVIMDNGDNLKKIKNDPVLMFQRLRNVFLKTKKVHFYRELGITKRFLVENSYSRHFNELDIFCFLHKKGRDDFLELCRTVSIIIDGVSCSEFIINRYFK